MKQLLIAAILVLMAVPADAAQASTKLEPYTKTTKGKTSLCGVNFTIVTTAKDKRAVSGYYGSIFVIAADKVTTAIRVDKFEQENRLVPIDWANIILHNADGSVIDAKNFTHVSNPEDSKGYSAITTDPKNSEMLMNLVFGGTLQVKETDSATDIDIPIGKPHDKSYLTQVSRCLVELNRNRAH